MPENVRSKKHQHHQQGSLLLNKGLVVAVRRTCSGAYQNDEQAGPLTPMPSWKLYENPSYWSLAAGAVASVTGLTQQGKEGEEGTPWVQKHGVEEADSEVMSSALREGPADSRLPFLSARKLAASFWEELQEEGQYDSRATLCNFSESPRSHLQLRPLSLSNSESPDSAKHHPSPSKVLEAPTRSQQNTRGSQPPPSLSPPLKAIMLMRPDTECITSQLRSSASNAASSCQISSPGKDAREEPGDLSDKYEHTDADSISLPFDYIKESSRPQALEELQMDQGGALFESSLSNELKRALSKVQQVEAAQISARKEVDGLLRRCADEVMTLKTKEQERIQAAVLSIMEELNMERKARRNAEMESKRLASSLEDANKVVLAAEKELEKEREARKLMEDVCDELAREIGEDKTEVEELKRELAKARDEIEEERKTLQVTEAWREERVQMKFSDAKRELEERCLTLDSLKLELESFLNQGKAHRVEASFEHGGKILREAIEKVQGEASDSVSGLDDARLFLSPHNHTISENVCSQQNLWSNKKDRLSVHVNACDSSDIEQAIHSAEHGGCGFGLNVESEGFAREDGDWLESTNVYSNERDKQWMNCSRTSRRRRGEVGMKSYGSKARGLSNMGDRGLGEDWFNDFEHRNRAGSDTGSRGDYSSDCRFSTQEEGNWSADGEEDNGVLRQRDIASWSASEQERGLRFLPKCGKEITNRSLGMMNAEGRHGTARVQQCHVGKSATRAEQRYNRDSHLKSLISQAKHHMLATEEDSEFSSVAGYSPAYKSHMPSPDLVTLKRSCHIANPNKRSASLGRRTVHNSVEWSKPYKKNSLQAKLLLEDGLIGQNFKLRH